MVTIGRKPSRRVGIPNNKNMVARANAHLENYAVRKSEHFEISLGVDAPMFYFWYRNKGSVPCSCSSNFVGLNKNFTPGEATGATNSDSMTKLDPRWKVTGFGEVAPPDKFQTTRDATLKEQLEEEYDPETDDFDDLTDIDDLSQDSQSDPNDSLNLFNENMIACPICFGAGFIDAWTLNGGRRYVFDTSNLYGFNANGVDIDNDQKPYRMFSVNENSFVNWRFTLPLVWENILRLEVYNDIEVVSSGLYTWTWVNVDTSDTGPMTTEALEELQNTGAKLQLRLQFLEDGIEWTHAELVMAFREPYRAQIPEVQQGYQYEMLDWDINISVELPPHLNIEEGSYLTESKYGKVWKVNAINRRMTADRNIFGITADLRGLQPFEKKMSQLDLFRGIYDTFSGQAGIS